MYVGEAANSNHTGVEYGWDKLGACVPDAYCFPDTFLFYYKTMEILACICGITMAFQGLNVWALRMKYIHIDADLDEQDAAEHQKILGELQMASPQPSIELERPASNFAI